MAEHALHAAGCAAVVHLHTLHLTVLDAQLTGTSHDAWDSCGNTAAGTLTAKRYLL